MADGLSIDIETKEVEVMLSRLLKKVEKPKELMKTLERVVMALTKNMFTATPRPDTKGRRSVKWPKLKQSTINAKKARVKGGKSLVAARPMVDTGALRDSIKVLDRNNKGFVIGTKEKSDKNFNYPGFHNKGRFPMFFLSKQDFTMFQQATVDFLNGVLKNFKSYMKE